MDNDKNKYVTESFAVALRGNTTLTTLNWNLSEYTPVTHLEEITKLLERNKVLKGMQCQDLPRPDDF